MKAGGKNLHALPKDALSPSLNGPLMQIQTSDCNFLTNFANQTNQTLNLNH
jgi:hypothetical protein